MKSPCLNKNKFTDTYDIDSLLFMQNFMKVPFKMPEIFPNTLGGGLEIWASIYSMFEFKQYFIQNNYIVIP